MFMFAASYAPMYECINIDIFDFFIELIQFIHLRHVIYNGSVYCKI